MPGEPGAVYVYEVVSPEVLVSVPPPFSSTSQLKAVAWVLIVRPVKSVVVSVPVNVAVSSGLSVRVVGVTLISIVVMSPVPPQLVIKRAINNLLRKTRLVRRIKSS